MPRPVLEWEKRLGRRLTLRDLRILIGQWSSHVDELVCRRTADWVP